MKFKAYNVITSRNKLKKEIEEQRSRLFKDLLDSDVDIKVLDVCVNTASVTFDIHRDPTYIPIHTSLLSPHTIFSQIQKYEFKPYTDTSCL